MGRAAAAVPRAQRLPRGDLPHVLLQPDLSTTSASSPGCCAWSARTPSRSSAIGGCRPSATSGRAAPASCTVAEAVGAACRQLARSQAGHPLHAGLPVRRGGRRRPAGRLHRLRGRAGEGRTGRDPARRQRVDVAGRRRALAGRASRRRRVRARRRPQRPRRPAARRLARPSRAGVGGSPGSDPGRGAVRLPGLRAQPLPALRRRATATSATWSPGRSRPGSPMPGPTSSSGSGPRRSPSSTAPRPTSSPTSATSSARR